MWSGRRSVCVPQHVICLCAWSLCYSLLFSPACEAQWRSGPGSPRPPAHLCIILCTHAYVCIEWGYASVPACLFYCCAWSVAPPHAYVYSRLYVSSRVCVFYVCFLFVRTNALVPYFTLPACPHACLPVLLSVCLFVCAKSSGLCLPCLLLAYLPAARLCMAWCICV